MTTTTAALTPSPSLSRPSRPRKMHRPKYTLFFDHHTMAACPDVGQAFDAQAFADQVARCGVDLVGFAAKCNQGFCYYDTARGIRHPSLQRDLFGEMLAACQARGIAVSAYLNCGLSHEEALRHPDWNTLGPDGRTLHPDPGGLGWVTPYIRTLCVNSPYRDHLMGLIREVAGKYPVAGFLLDSFNGFPCVCPTCIALMEAQGIDWRDSGQLRLFARSSVLRLAQDIAALVRSLDADLLLYFLGIDAQDNVRLGSYLECECLPTYPSWGYDYLPILSRHLRTLADDGRPVLNMTGRFYEWGDFGSLRPQAALEHDLFLGIANGMRPNIGGHLHPRGCTQPAIFDRIHDVYHVMQRHEPWYDAAVNLTDIAVLSPGPVGKTPALIGATRMLSELKMQFDVITAQADLHRYRLLLLPDEVTLSPALALAVARFIEQGGAVVATGHSGLDQDKQQFALPDQWGVSHVGPCPFDPAYFEPTPAISQGLPDMPLALYQRGIAMQAGPQTQVDAWLVRPYTNRHWDGVYAHFYLPPDRVTDWPLVTRHGQVSHIAAPLFTAYHGLASVELRTLLANVLALRLPDPLVKVTGLPSFGIATVTRQGRRRMVHLLNYVPQLRGRSEIVEERLPAMDVQVALRHDGDLPQQAYLAPTRQPLPVTIQGRYAHVTIPRMLGYQLVAWE